MHLEGEKEEKPNILIKENILVKEEVSNKEETLQKRDIRKKHMSKCRTLGGTKKETTYGITYV